MAVQSDTSRIQYAGNNSTTTSYAVPFVFQENAHLKAIARTSAGVESVVTLTNHTGAGNVNGGTVRTAVDVPATSTLTIYREVPATQTTTYAEGGDFPAASHERALDKLTQIAQQLKRGVESSVRLGEATPISPLLVPNSANPHVLTTVNGGAPTWETVPSVSTALNIPALTAAATVNASDELIIQQSGITKRATVSELISNATVATAEGTTQRNLPDRFSDTINVLDFGAVGDGVTDDKAAFEAARDSIPSGGRSIIIVPAGQNGNNSYFISSPIATNGRLIHWHFLAGASVVGGSLGKFSFPTRNTEYGATGGRREFSAQAPDAVLGQASHEFTEIYKGGSTTQGYGIRWNYSSGAFGSGFDIAHGIIGVWDRNTGQNNGYGLISWRVAIGPINGGATTKWGVFTAEYNAVNRHADHGWSKKRGTLQNWIGIHQIVPEAQLFSQAGTSYDILFGTVYSRSADLKADGYPARFHNAILCEPNTITAAGRFIYASGRDSDVDASQTPVAILEADDDWQRGISTRRANLTSGIAYGLGATQLIGWLNSSDAVLNGIYSGTGSPEGVTTAPVGSLFLRRDGGAATTLYVKESGTGNTGWAAK